MLYIIAAKIHIYIGLEKAHSKLSIFGLWFFMPVTIFLLNGCISNPSYPKGWASLAVDQGCPSLDGYYEDRGRDPSGYQYLSNMSLYLHLIGGEALNILEIKSAHIKQTDSKISIEALSDKTPIKQRIFHFNENDCDEGFLKIEVPDSTKFYDTSYSQEISLKSFYKLAKSKDGSLVLVIWATDAALVSLVIPLARTEKQWYRFASTEPPDR